MSETVVPWKVPIADRGSRSIELEQCLFGRAGLTLTIRDAKKEIWALTFAEVQALQLTTDECAGYILASFPTRDSFFEVMNSNWIEALGGEEARPLADSRHFIVACYDEVVEIVADGCEIVARAD